MNEGVCARCNGKGYLRRYSWINRARWFFVGLLFLALALLMVLGEASGWMALFFIGFIVVLYLLQWLLFIVDAYGLFVAMTRVPCPECGD